METTVDPPMPLGSTETSTQQWSGQRRFKYFATGVIGPIGCLVTAFLGTSATVETLWQSGKLNVYLILMLEPKALMPFVPLLVYSMVALGACCVNPLSGRNFWVRVGVYGGVFLSAQYLLFVACAQLGLILFCPAVVAPSLALVTFIGAKLMPRARRITIFQMMLFTFVVALVAAVGRWLGINLASDGSDDFLEYGAALLIWMLGAVPLLNFITYVRASLALLRNCEPVVKKARKNGNLLALALSWIAGYFASWKFALDAMLIEYANLPTTEPSCYVSSAAACGHPRFVGVTKFLAHEPANTGFPLNDQMCRLKFLELALAAFSPTWHRLVRRSYDAIGPNAALICRSNAWFADASYLALKPIELLAYLIQTLSNVSPNQVRGLYVRPKR